MSGADTRTRGLVDLSQGPEARVDGALVQVEDGGHRLPERQHRPRKPALRGAGGGRARPQTRWGWAHLGRLAKTQDQSGAWHDAGLCATLEQTSAGREWGT